MCVRVCACTCDHIHIGLIRTIWMWNPTNARATSICPKRTKTHTQSAGPALIRSQLRKQWAFARISTNQNRIERIAVLVCSSAYLVASSLSAIRRFHVLHDICIHLVHSPGRYLSRVNGIYSMPLSNTRIILRRMRKHQVHIINILYTFSDRKETPSEKLSAIWRIREYRVLIVCISIPSIPYYIHIIYV